MRGQLDVIDLSLSREAWLLVLRSRAAVKVLSQDEQALLEALERGEDQLVELSWGPLVLERDPRLGIQDLGDRPLLPLQRSLHLTFKALICGVHKIHDFLLRIGGSV